MLRNTTDTAHRPRGANIRALLLTAIDRDAVKKTLQHVLTEYGTIGLMLYLTIFFAVLGGFLFAMWLGWEPAGTATRAGTVAAAYVATKLTLPLRIAATVMLTPLVARLYDRVRGSAGTQAQG